MKRILSFIAASTAFAVLSIALCSSTPYTRGIGVYPGNPAETFAPQLVENTEYCNIAAFKAAYHSSAHDYNLTAQLATDGIITGESPASLRMFTQNGEIQKRERDWFFDGKPDSKFTLSGTEIFLQLNRENFAPHADRMVLGATVEIDPAKPRGYTVKGYASCDGDNWDEIGTITAADIVTFGKTFQKLEFPMSIPSKGYSYFKYAIDMPGATDWTFHTWEFFDGAAVVPSLPADKFSSVWKAASAGQEWIYVDFGSKAKFDRIVLNWVNKAVRGSVQTSNDAKTWKTVAALPGGDSKEDEIKVSGSGRYVRLLLEESADGRPYELSEFQVFGTGGLKPIAAAAPAPTSTRQDIAGGGWKLQRLSLVEAGGEELSKVGFNDKDWVIATVPGTVLSSFINNGSVPDPNFADNQLQVSDSYFISDFWYRNEFEVNNAAESKFLNFDGINWKADIFVNGKPAGHIDGAFMRGKFDVSDLIVEGKNAIAVHIFKNAHPGAIKEQTAFSADQNGGIPGADNPTFHASIGWDWIPTIRGRNIGIWNDVYLTFNGPVTVEDPFIRAELPLPDTSEADLFFETTLKNHSGKAVSGVLKGLFGDIPFETEVALKAGEEKLVKLDASNTPALHLVNPELWWPKGYGEPYLYDVRISYEVAGVESDAKEFKSGVRQMTYEDKDNILSVFINGRRFIGFGGNWGFSESNLNYRGREYDAAVAYHADMNFTIIRNWVGQVGDEEFYEACDRHGVMIWQDFWLANPWDGPDPYYPEMFLDNAKDYVKRIRNHASLAIYVGRNEGMPPAQIDKELREDIIPQLHPGMCYIPHSAAGSVSGGGPYRALDPKAYYSLHGHNKMHSERGAPNVMTYENLLRTFGPDRLNPVNTAEHPNNMYGLHDYTLTSAQGADSFNKIIAKAFGEPKDAAEFAKYAQLINYNTYRAIFEARSEYRRGMILWMSHPAWPSMVWQTYDYYFEPTGTYFGCKKACEPLHIQWNPASDNVEVVNYHTCDHTGLTAKAQVVNLYGKVEWEKEAVIDIKDDATAICFPLEFPETLTETYFIKLVLSDGSKVLSDNFYFAGKEEGNFQAVKTLPAVKLSRNVRIEKRDDVWTIKGTVKNNTKTPALMIRLKVTGSKDKEMILPVLYNDNYFSLLPGEQKEISISFKNEDTRGEIPVLNISGFNVK